MIEAFFHAWERRLAAVTTDRVVRPFEWGLDWIGSDAPAAGDAGMAADHAAPDDAAAPEPLSAWVTQVMADTDAFYTPEPTSEYTLGHAESNGDRILSFPSALTTPHPKNNTVYCRLIEPKRTQADRPPAAVLVLPQWNSDEGGHVGLCRLLAMNGLTALRLSLPYHDRRMPPELRRADYIVSANIARTLQVCRQAVLDARRAISVTERQRYILRVRTLARGVAQAYYASREALGFPLAAKRAKSA